MFDSDTSSEAESVHDEPLTALKQAIRDFAKHCK